jgi:hypothetical protein
VVTDRHEPPWPSEAWPVLPFEAWQDTLATIHRWTQIVGKIGLELTTFLNEWWNVALHVSARGLTIGPMPAAGGAPA